VNKLEFSSKKIKTIGEKAKEEVNFFTMELEKKSERKKSKVDPQMNSPAPDLLRRVIFLVARSIPSKSLRKICLRRS
jgi:hypothetical protein